MNGINSFKSVKLYNLFKFTGVVEGSDDHLFLGYFHFLLSLLGERDSAASEVHLPASLLRV